MPELFQQHRRVNLDGLVAEAQGLQTDLDIGISVRTREKSLAFTVGIYNLSEENWRAIRAKDQLSIELGWLETGIEPVCLGRVESNDVEYLNGGTDTRYIIEGVDATQEAFASRISYTFGPDPDPGQIAADIVADIEGVIGVQVETVGQSIPGYYPIKNDRPLRYWLDTLVDEASNMTDEQWEWMAHAGKFYFRPKSDTGEVSVDLTDRVQSVEPASGQSDSDTGEEIQVTAYCHPMVEKGAVVSLSTESYAGEYKVVEYEFVSDTVSGEHYVQATLVPNGAPFSAAYPGTGLFHGGRAPYREGFIER